MAIYFIYSYISTSQFNESVSFCVFLNRLESLLTDPKWPICLAFRSEKDQSGSFINRSLDIQNSYSFTRHLLLDSFIRETQYGVELYMTGFPKFILSKNAWCGYTYYVCASKGGVPIIKMEI